MMKEDSNVSFYVGTYTQGKSKGIYKSGLQSNGTLKEISLVATTNNPSFLAKSLDEKILVAVNEEDDKDGGGTIESYAIKNNSLKRIDRKSSGGTYPCFVTINKLGYIVVANYGDGTIGLLKLLPNGEMSALLDVQQHKGSGTTPRQEGPHAHSVYFEDQKTHIISLDLGTNELWFSSIDTAKEKFAPMKPKKLMMPEGSGPRHMTIHPNRKWFYVLNELSSTISLLKKSESGNLKTVNSISTLPKEYKGSNICADIHVSSDGKFIYASNRGHDSIAIYKVDSYDGTLVFIDYELTLGKIPRSFSLSHDENFLVVANQKTDTLVSFKRNKSDGTLEFIDKIKVPNPVCILF